MKNVSIRRGATEILILMGGISFSLTAFLAWSQFTHPNILNVLALIPLTGFMVWMFVNEWRKSRGHFSLKWRGQQVQIMSGCKIVFDGTFANMAKIDQDLQCYYLYPCISDVYRLQRSLVNDELRDILDGTTPAEQGADDTPH